MSQTYWQELTIKCPAELREAVTAVLFQRGCLGISEEYDTLRAYFPGSADTSAVGSALEGFEGVSCEVAGVGEQDWYAGWKKTIGPFRVAGLLICPPWKKEECVPAEGEKLVILDPGQAFGTGEHESTAAVLGMLSSWAKRQTDVSAKRLLDLGTGTGILSVAAWMYGVREITAVDVEQKAVDTAAANFESNGLSGHIRLLHGGIDEAGTGYDMILANIFQEVLLEVMPRVSNSLNPGGEAVLAGLLSGQEAKVVRLAESCGLSLREREAKGDWVCVRLSAQPLPARP